MPGTAQSFVVGATQQQNRNKKRNITETKLRAKHLSPSKKQVQTELVTLLSLFRKKVIAHTKQDAHNHPHNIFP